MNPFSSPVIAEPDVCIVGGGAAGMSAAVACGRLGLKSLLLEKYGFCGGDFLHAEDQSMIGGLGSASFHAPVIRLDNASKRATCSEQRISISLPSFANSASLTGRCSAVKTASIPLR